MDYFTCINYSKQDLYKYSKNDILEIAKLRNISLDNNYDNLIEKLAKDIIDDYYKNANLDYSDCTNNLDYITQDEWTNKNEPDIKIFYINDPDKKAEIICLQKSSLFQIINLPNNNVVGWIPQNYKIIDKTGYGGRPSYMERFTKIIDKYIDNSEIFELNPNEVYFSAIPVYKNKRIANPKTEFGMSELHGQLPGETIYHLFIGPLTKGKAIEIYNYYYTMKLKEKPISEIYNSDLKQILHEIIEFNDSTYYIDDNVKLIKPNFEQFIKYLISRDQKLIFQRKEDKYYYLGIDRNPDLEELEEEGFINLKIISDPLTDDDLKFLKTYYNKNFDFQNEINYIMEHESENF